MIFLFHMFKYAKQSSEKSLVDVCIAFFVLSFFLSFGSVRYVNRKENTHWQMVTRPTDVLGIEPNACVARTSCDLNQEEEELLFSSFSSMIFPIGWLTYIGWIKASGEREREREMKKK